MKAEERIRKLEEKLVLIGSGINTIINTLGTFYSSLDETVSSIISRIENLETNLNAMAQHIVEFEKANAKILRDFIKRLNALESALPSASPVSTSPVTKPPSESKLPVIPEKAPPTLPQPSSPPSRPSLNAMSERMAVLKELKAKLALLRGTEE